MRRKNVKLAYLTRGEEEIMQIIWKLEKAGISDILEHLKNPKPAYTTIATFVKLLENKGYVKHKKIGKSYLFMPAIHRDVYAKRDINLMLSTYFGGSISQMVSFFSQNEQISLEEMDEIVKIMDEVKKSHQDQSQE